jgi:hypothetical protein
VDETSEEWNALLPTDRHASDSEKGQGLTVGDYFSIAVTFLSADEFRVPRFALETSTGRTYSLSSIETIDICLVKHGTFYHPARIDIKTNDNCLIPVALNLAISPEGIGCIDREFTALETVSNAMHYTPRVFGKSTVTHSKGRMVSMFAAEWFDGYFEFHASFNGPESATVVWDTDRGNYFLTGDQAYEVYRQAATILTLCYNIDSGRQIQPWHHAAGDFVLRKDGGNIDVKLITVRQYTSLFNHEIDDDALIDAVLIFLISLSIRMRLDRVDGIHDLVWLSDSVLQATVAGFLDGLSRMSSPRLPMGSPRTLFLEHTSGLTASDVMDYAMMVIGAYHPDSPDLPLIKKNLDSHITFLVDMLKTVAGGK